jgi:hypothetical protein
MFQGDMDSQSSCIVSRLKARVFACQGIMCVHQVGAAREMGATQREGLSSDCDS